jgi:vitamin B12 transporter
MVIKMKLVSLYSSLFGLFFFVNQSFSQQIDSPTLETIVVTGARTPIPQNYIAGAVTVIEQEYITSSQAFNLSDLLRGLAGISISQSGGTGSLNELRMRGSESNHVLVLLDGIEINDLGQGDAANFAHLNLENVQRIEILRGPQSALWGSGAVGGVINIISKQGGEKNNIFVKAEVGQANSRRLALNVTGQNDELSYGLSASHFATDGQNISRTGTEKDGYKNSQVGANGLWQVNQTNLLEFSLRYLSARNEFDDYLPADADNYTDVSQYSGKLVWHYQPQNSNWDQQLGWQINDNDNQTFENQQFSNGSNSDKQRLFWLNQFSYGANNHINLVAEHVKEHFQQGGVASYFGDPNQSQHNKITSFVADVLHQLGENLSFTASARADNNDIYNNSNSYNLGLAYHLNSRLKLYSSYAKGIKNPTFVETFGFFPLAFIGNQDLRPERAKNWEVGAQFLLPTDWTTSISYYNAQLEDEIVTVFSADYSTSSSINSSGKSKRQGAELSLQGDIANVRINASYAWLDASQPDTQGLQQREARRAKHTGSVSADYSFADNKTQFFVQASYQGQQLDTDFNSYPATPVTLAAYLLWNTAFSYQISPELSLTLRGENIFDKGYEDVFGFVAQSRRLFAGFSYAL